MKKFVALLLAAAMLCGFSTLSFAAESTKPLAEAIAADYMRPSYNGTPNMLLNSSFEELNENGGPKEWEAAPNPNGGDPWVDSPLVSVDTTFARSGEQSLKFTMGEDKKVPWIRQSVRVTPNTSYQFSVWLYTDLLLALNAKSVRFYIEYYSGIPSSGNYIGSSKTDYFFPLKANRWEQFSHQITQCPEGTAVAQFYMWLDSPCTVWIDDYELYQLTSPAKTKVNVDQFFYYEDVTTGYATADILPEHANFYKDGKFDFYFLDKEGNVIKEQKDSTIVDGGASFSYPVSQMTELKTAYTVKAVLKDKNGELVDEQFKEVYRYNRPTQMTADGHILDSNGNPYYGQTILYGSNYNTSILTDEMQAMGIRMPLLSTGPAYQHYALNNGLLKRWLDQLAENNMMGIVSLHSLGLPSNPMARPMVEKVINDFKDHPAVAAWGVSDEPWYNYKQNAEHGSIESYKLVRNLDDKHPVYLVEMTGYITEASKYCDFFTTDPYVGNPPTAVPKYEAFPTLTQNPGSFAGSAYAVARRVCDRYGKPFGAVNQAFDWKGYVADLEQMRSFVYQSIFEGVYVDGWFTYTAGRIPSFANMTMLRDQGIIDYEAFLQNMVEEKNFAFDTFGAKRTYPLFTEFKDDNLAYRGVVKDGKLYLMVLNRKAEAQTVEISLKSQNGLLTASGTPEEMYLIGESVKPTVDGDKLTLSMQPASVSVIALDAIGAYEDSLNQPSFADLAGYEWAEAAVEEMYRAGVIAASGDRAFAPGEMITRGDFAKALMRALDLNVVDGASANGTDINMDTIANFEEYENFSDVPADSPYVREVKVGKFLGILKGTGDNTFNPEAPITRQDLMVICQRGLRVAMKASGDKADLSVYSDNALLADYAREAVAAMNYAGVVKGNADGTLNPLGNTTRAEAAVIMQRIRGIA